MTLAQKKEIGMIGRMLVESTDECFCVKLESDDAGSHYTLYLVNDSVAPSLINANMRDLNLSKHHVIIYLEEERVHNKRKENERK